MTGFYHSLGLDCFILSMPLKGVNIGPGSNASYVEDEHWWFLQWEQRGDYALRYFVEPAYLTANYAFAQGYEQLHMAGLSGGGWTTTVAAAIDKRITASFPIAGSVPCSLRLAPTKSNPVGYWPNQRWTGTSRDGDFEQSCAPPAHANSASGGSTSASASASTSNGGGGSEPPCIYPTQGSSCSSPGRAAYEACNYTCTHSATALPCHLSTSLIKRHVCGRYVPLGWS